MRLQTVVGILVVTVVMGVARAEHTAADARATTAKLEAIRRAAYAPPAKKKKAPPPKAEAKADAKVDAKPDAKTDATRDTQAATKKHKESDGDPMWSMIGHAMAIPFDAKEREAHFRDIPTTPAEIDAHLRRLDAALAAKHQHR